MNGVFGVMAEFEKPEELLEAARRAHQQGYRKMEAYSPFPIPDLAKAVGFRRSFVPLACLIAGLCGGSTAYLLQFWINTMAFPVHVGGRPMHSWPSFIPVTFEMSVLFAGFGAFFGMWILNGLPRPYHPVFGVKRFAAVTRDRFFLCIEAKDPSFELETTRAFLWTLHPQAVEEVLN